MASTRRRTRPRRTEQDRPTSFKVRLDWKAYFKRFCQDHGDSVSHAGRLLFQDGWTYSSTDYEGPEWQPPKDPKELKSLQLAYWQIRLGIVTSELRSLQDRLRYLEEAQSIRATPLQQRVSYMEEKNGKMVSVVDRVDLDLDGLKGRVSWLEADMVECREKLKELNDGNS